MKLFYIFIVVTFTSCSLVTPTSLPSLSDSTIIKLITEKYTQNNKLDGTEFATVNNISIKEKKMNLHDKTCLVTYHISCSYQPAATSPEYPRQPPPSLDVDTTATLIVDNNIWHNK